MTDKFTGRMVVSGLTDVGLTRDHNEDSYGVVPEIGLLLVCDGMGGHAKGEVASRMAVDVIQDFLYEYAPEPSDQPDPEETMADAPVSTEEHTLREAVKRANQLIYDENRQSGYSDGVGMGTTLVGLWLSEQGRRGWMFHVGDSRGYLFRNGRLEQMTTDHTLYNEWVAMGSEGTPPKRNIIMRALGPSSEVTPDIRSVEFQPADLVLICSDGLSTMASDEAIAEVLSRCVGPDLAVTCGELVDLAKKGGGKDNVTVVLGRWL